MEVEVVFVREKQEVIFDPLSALRFFEIETSNQFRSQSQLTSLREQEDGSESEEEGLALLPDFIVHILEERIEYVYKSISIEAINPPNPNANSFEDEEAEDEEVEEEEEEELEEEEEEEVEEVVPSDLFFLNLPSETQDQACADLSLEEEVYCLRDLVRQLREANEDLQNLPIPPSLSSLPPPLPSHSHSLHLHCVSVIILSFVLLSLISVLFCRRRKRREREFLVSLSSPVCVGHSPQIPQYVSAQI